MFISKQISVNVYCIREIDQYNNDHVLMYLIKGSANQCILIDTGFGCNGDLLVYIRSNQLAADHQSIIVINTHNHAEQTGGNWRFSSSNSKYGLSHKICDLCASSADVIYTKMIDWRVKPYKITRWIDHGEEIQIDNDNRIVIYHTPGENYYYFVKTCTLSNISDYKLLLM
jgi:glyoxylase-like metal-dependent hydrolase (beta-lactamase superfamily II)